MSKTLKVSIKRTEAGGVTHYDYPPGYDAQKMQVLCYEVGEECSGRMDGRQFLIGVVADKDAPQFLASPDIQEMVEEDAIETGSRWRPQVERIADPNAVLSILAKNLRGGELSEEDLQVIDPDNPIPGVNKSKSFVEILTETRNAKKYK